MNVIWLPKALGELEKAIRYSKREFGTKAAQKFIAEVKQNNTRLMHPPEWEQEKSNLVTCKQNTVILRYIPTKRYITLRGKLFISTYYGIHTGTLYICKMK